MAKKLFIKTYGCQMNVYDSRRMADVLAPLGFRPVEAPEGADFIILNTCHIREKAAEKVYSELGRLKHLKKNRERNGATMDASTARPYVTSAISSWPTPSPGFPMPARGSGLRRMARCT